MKKLAIFTLAAATAISLMAADGASLYKKCAGCHGAKGEKKALGKSKVVAEMTHAEIATALKGYKAGTYGGPMKGVMKGQVAKDSEADLRATDIGK